MPGRETPEAVGPAAHRSPDGRTGGGRTGSGRAADLRVRILSSAVLAPIVLSIVWIGGWAYVGLVAATGALIVSEWSGVSRGRYLDTAVAVGGLATVASVTLLALVLPGAAVAILLIGAAGALAVARKNRPGRLLGLGVIYAGVPSLALVVLRADPAYGLAAIVWLLVVIWATDIGGYAVGRFAGGPKLAPWISPKKTWSGFLGGLIFAGLASFAFSGLAIGGGGDPATTMPVWLAVAVSIVSQAGDLAQSAFKRRFGAKDSSPLIPGHGGLWDRVDGFVAAATLAAAIGIARAGPEAAGTGLMLW